MKQLSDYDRVQDKVTLKWQIFSARAKLQHRFQTKAQK